MALRLIHHRPGPETGWKPILHCAVAASRWVRGSTGRTLFAAHSLFLGLLFKLNKLAG
jgi:hypothetical protein